MANWANPTLTSLYTDVLTQLKDRDTDLALQFDGTTSTSLTTGTIRWNSTANRWQKWNGTTWAELTTTYALTGLSTTGNASIGGTLSVTGSTALGTATATTVATGDSSTNIATTAFVKNQAYATLASPALTGTPTAPTAAVGTNTTQVATTAFVNAEIANDAPTKTGTGASGTWSISVTGSAASATTGTTQVSSDSSTNLATTAYVKSLLSSASTAGTLDWNDVSNTRPGVGPTLLLGSATNGPGGGFYYYPFTVEYAGTAGTGNVTQFAIGYNTLDTYQRYRFSGTWTGWVRAINTGNFNSYAPTLTGTGASGTWGISISGTAATATNQSGGTVNATTGSFTPNTNGVSSGFNVVNGDITVYRSGGTTGVVYFGTSGTKYLYYDGTNYLMPGGQLDVNGSRVLNAGNFNSYAPTLTGTGASGTWAISISGGTVNATTGAFSGDVTMSGTGQLKVPAGTTAQRSGTPAAGMVRYNSTLNQFEGYGTAWGQIGGGATGGGGDTVFMENGNTVTTSYSITAGKNAVTAGPITINAGATVTVPSGSTWVIV